MLGANRHIANSVLIIYPSVFYSNPETSASNKFQSIQKKPGKMEAQKEFEALETALRSFGIQVLRFDSDPGADTPDALFPNNWISTHSDGKIFLYPMEAENRRRERRSDIVQKIQSQFGFSKVVDISAEEKKGKFLEGTGALILDRKNKEGFCCLSSRAHPELVQRFESISGFSIFSFSAVDAQQFPIYHTNVMMSFGETQVLVCLESVPGRNERAKLVGKIKEKGRNLIEISMAQMSEFCGNIILLENHQAERAWFLSERAYQNLNATQKRMLEKDGQLIPVSIPIVEQLGGGSVRCMIAEIFT